MSRRIFRALVISTGVLLSTLGVWSIAAEGDSVEQVPTDTKQLSLQEIVDNTNRVAYYQGQDGAATVSMTITDAQGRTRSLVFTILRRDDLPPEDAPVKQTKPDEYCRDQRFYVYFHRPADVNKMVFLVWKHVDRDDDRWLYLPALDLVKRIAATDKRTSFVGSDFFYEDVSGRNTNEDVHELLETSKTYYVLKNTPKKPKEVEFAFYKMWIHRTTFIPVQIEYYDAKDKPYRVYKAEDVKIIQGYPTVVKARMTDLKSNSYTVTEYSGVRYNLSIPEDIFTERYLRRPPQQYLRQQPAE